jgi:arsenate reductase
MNKAFYLSSCSTCNRILKELKLDESVELQDIKTNKISPEQLDEMKRLAGSYEELFSRRSMQYRKRGLHEQELTEKDYRSLILEEYTFLKRPVFVLGEEIFIGNSSKTVVALKEALNQ